MPLDAAGATSLSTLAAVIPIKSPTMSLRERTRPGLGIIEPNMRTASLIMLSGLFVQVAHADEIRRATFPKVMLGTWAETAEQCAAKDKTNIVIEATKYRDGGGDCTVRWIVETAGSGGINYAVHSLCISASLPEKTQNKNIVVRPLGPDRAAMGQSFEDLKTYQRCP